ncbi:MAG: tetratricopeptide repeat protein [Weeksellaceae bacterium]|nr:tetratricopeptide repeat protein [Weeksellaceae bacterium]
MRKYICIIGIAWAGITGLHAQQSHINFDKNQDFRLAQFLRHTETYHAAQHHFEKAVIDPRLSNDTREAAEFYAALTALSNNQRGAEERFLAFQRNYPMSLYVQDGAWELGSFYLRNGDFDQALKYLTMGNLNDLPERKRNEYQFKLGYAYFMKNNKAQALRHLEPLTRSERFQDEANYYVGHIHYSNKDFDRAQTYFDALRSRNSAYEDKLLPYMVQIKFNNGQYQSAIDDGKLLLSKNRDRFIQSEVSKIVGESYFALQQYDAAIPYLEAYTGNLTNVDYYQLGYAYYQQGNYETAMTHFNKIIDERNAMAQNAYYQLGNTYLQVNRKREALSAYKSASEMDFDKQLQEDGFYNYAKLSYEIGNPFEGTPQVLQSFVQKYPRSPHQSEINDLLIDSYISSGHYVNALEVLGQISNQSPRQRQAQQLAAFMHGIVLLNDGKPNEAETHLRSAARSDANREIQARSTFWLGDVLYKQGRYSNALEQFSAYQRMNVATPESKELQYQLGYTHFKLKQFDRAAQAFQSYLASNPPGEFRTDARMRLADSHIGNRNPQAAVQIYGEIADANENHADEAAYNKAVVLGIQGNIPGKIADLESFLKRFPRSKFYQEAQLELADAYIKNNEAPKADRVLNDVIRTGNAENKARAHLRKGLIHYNQNRNTEALAEFNVVAETYPNTDLARQAIENAKRIYFEEGRVADFERWASGFAYYSIDKAELETLAYDNAMRHYDSKNYTAAITHLHDFTTQYPRSAYSNAVLHALGESYYQTNRFDEAVPHFTQVAASANERQEDALLRLSQIYLNQQKSTEALLSLETLHNTTRNPSYISFAEMHLMRLYSAAGRHDKAVNMANNVIANSRNETAVIEEAEVIKARSLMASNRRNDARRAYEALQNANSHAVRAEAKYYQAYFLTADKKYEQSNEVIFDLASNYSSQQYWGAKALVVMAENYYQLKDLYQANHTIDAILKNYQNFPDVIQEAKTLQTKIKNRR